MSLRRASPIAAGLWTGREVALGAGREVALGAGRSAALVAGRRSGRHVSIFGAGSSRSLSTGRFADKFSPYLQASQLWVRDKGKKYEKYTKGFKEADEILKISVQIGKYLFTFFGCAVTGLYYLIDIRVDKNVSVVSKDLDEKLDKLSKQLNQKVDDLSKSHLEFKGAAVRDFQNHVSKTQLGHSTVQSDVNGLHQKLLDLKEDFHDHRHEILEAAQFLKLRGYIIMSTEEFTALSQKVSEIDQRTVAQTANQQKVDASIACTGNINVSNLPNSTKSEHPRKKGTPDGTQGGADDVENSVVSGGKTALESADSISGEVSDVPNLPKGSKTEQAPKKGTPDGTQDGADDVENSVVSGGKTALESADSISGEVSDVPNLPKSSKTEQPPKKWTPDGTQDRTDDVENSVVSGGKTALESADSISGEVSDVLNLPKSSKTEQPPKKRGNGGNADSP